MTWEIHTGDVLDRLRLLPDGSVHCVVTSPPYWGLRDYGVEGQIGLEASPDEHVAKLIDAFREVRRVLRADGTLWLNYGDAYAGSWGAQSREHAGKHAPNVSALSANQVKHAQIRESGTGSLARTPGLKPKDLIGLPWLLAFALRADGWWLRADIVWNKPNPMPESVRDRPTRSHEFVFLLTKSARYYYDADAVREPHVAPGTINHGGGTRRAGIREDRGNPGNGTCQYHPAGRNARSVWTINPQPFPEAHFATFPEALAERCILAGTSAHGCCAKCGAPLHRETKSKITPTQRTHNGNWDASSGYGKSGLLPGRKLVETVGWSPTCDCAADGAPRVVLDPFAGSGTTLVVAERLGRDSIGVELNEEYAAIARRRIERADPMVAKEVAPGVTQGALWGGDSA